MRRLHQPPQHDDPDVQTTRSTTPRRQRADSTRFAARPPPAALSALFGQAFGSHKPKTPQITTAPGQHGAGETETEADEPVSSRVTPFLVAGSPKPRDQSSRLPTTRILPVSEPLVPPTLVTTLLFESSRLLSVVPATCGVLVNAWCLWYPPGYSPTSASSYDHSYSIANRSKRWGRGCPPDRGDYFIAILWVCILHRLSPYFVFFMQRLGRHFSLRTNAST